jgi:hypothetical protein
VVIPNHAHSCSADFCLFLQLQRRLIFHGNIFPIDLSMDLSLIPCDVEEIKENVMGAQASRPGVLTPIKEESSASSKSSSRYN